MKKRGKEIFQVYQFDLEGNLMDIFASATVVAEKLNKKENNINTSIRRESCMDSMYYLSRNKKFVIPSKKKNRNPLLGKRNFSHFAEQDLFQPSREHLFYGD